MTSFTPCSTTEPINSREGEKKEYVTFVERGWAAGEGVSHDVTCDVCISAVFVEKPLMELFLSEQMAMLGSANIL